VSACSLAGARSPVAPGGAALRAVGAGVVTSRTDARPRTCACERPSAVETPLSDDTSEDRHRSGADGTGATVVASLSEDSSPFGTCASTARVDARGPVAARPGSGDGPGLSEPVGEDRCATGARTLCDAREAAPSVRSPAPALALGPVDGSAGAGRARRSMLEGSGSTARRPATARPATAPGDGPGSPGTGPGPWTSRTIGRADPPVARRLPSGGMDDPKKGCPPRSGSLSALLGEPSVARGLPLARAGASMVGPGAWMAPPPPPVTLAAAGGRGSPAEAGPPAPGACPAEELRFAARAATRSAAAAIFRWIAA
jgi:hypothetical protein